jgi:uncharacterized repeat protein (TIGR01451 family)
MNRSFSLSLPSFLDVHHIIKLLPFILAVMALLMLIFPLQPAVSTGEAVLTITPITWNVIGLDSNRPHVGPNRFPVGARVCNQGGAPVSGLTADFVWEDLDETYIRLRTGTLSSLSVSSLDGEGCTDFYFEVEVTRDAAAYRKTRGYYIEVSADDAETVRTPRPRELYIEYLIAQSRNSTTDILLSSDGVVYESIPQGAAMTLSQGSTYWIKLVASTATNGYEQIESFINLPNTIFQIHSVKTTYDSRPWPDHPRVKHEVDELYTDGCLWQNNPLSPNYRSCLETGKAGGEVTVIYQVTILSVPSVNPEPLNTLIYDFSGASYHYNSDFGGSTRYAYIVAPTIVKSFQPNTILPGDTSTLTFMIANPGSDPVSDVNFVDNFPAGMTISGSDVTYSGCGSPEPGTLTDGSAILSFSDITVSASDTCVISLSVTASMDGPYLNTSENLHVGTQDTGSYATGSLVVSSLPPPPSSCASPTTLAAWTMPDSSGPPPPFTTIDGDVSFATASSMGGTPSIVLRSGADYLWQLFGYWPTTGVPGPTTTPYFEFKLDISNFGGVFIGFAFNLQTTAQWTANNNNYIHIHTQPDSGSFNSYIVPTIYKKNNWYQITYTVPETGEFVTTFRINASGANTGASVWLDDIYIYGCPRIILPPPALSKAFEPVAIPQGETSALTFTFSNPNDSPITNVSFFDALPAGLVVDEPNGLTTPSCSTGAISDQIINANPGSSTINMSDATLSPGALCSFSVDIKGSNAGQYTNISSSITSNESGPNLTETGYGVSNLAVVAPPVIAKSFGADSIPLGGSTSLTFNITNPNPGMALNGIEFSDALPGGVVVSTPNGLTGSCGEVFPTALSGSSSISLSGASLDPIESCTFSVNVTGTSAGDKLNTVTVSSTDGGTGNTADASIYVKTESEAGGIHLLKQVSDNNNGPWYTSHIIPGENEVYYWFIIENTGEVPLSNISIADPKVDTSACAWLNPLPVAAFDDEDEQHIAYCVVGTTAGRGYHLNTATVQGQYGEFGYTSTPSSASYLNGNFGHLPSAYTNMNLYEDGGAMHLNGDAMLGYSVTADETDGWNYSEYTVKGTDDGIRLPVAAEWTAGLNGGDVIVTVTCPSGCFLYGWADWNRDYNFDGMGERIVDRMRIEPGDDPQTFLLSFDIPGDVLEDGVYFARFRISEEGLDLQPNGAAMTVGEIEDYKWVTKDGIVTPVTLSYFSSTRRGSTVTFEWSTDAESGNLGFNLYTDAPAGRQKLNASLIPSSVFDSLERTDYSYSLHLPQGRIFYIEDVSVLGQTRLHGPFDLGQVYGERQDAEIFDWAAISQEHKAKEDQRRGGWKHAAYPEVELLIRQDGLYRVTYEQLRAVGLDLNRVPSNQIAVLNRGQSVPAHVSTSGLFGPGQYIEFYGEALDTLYTDTNVYTLKLDNKQARPIKIENVRLNKKDSPVLYYMENVSTNNQLRYYVGAVGDDPWYEQHLVPVSAPVSIDISLDADDYLPGVGPAHLTLRGYGSTIYDHHFLVHLKDALITEYRFSDIAAFEIEAQLPGELLQPGKNTLVMTAFPSAGAPSDLIMYEGYTLTYPRAFTARDGRLTFTAAGALFQVNGLPSKDVIVYRLDEIGWTRLTNVEILADGEVYSARFTGSSQPAAYSVSTVGALHTPALRLARPYEDITSKPADYLIISHPDFIDGLQPLVAAHQAQGLTVNVVDVEAIYAQYGYGIFNPYAIKDYIFFMASRTEVKYVLLVGGDTYDYRNYMGGTPISFLPSLYAPVTRTARYAPVDPLFVDLNGDLTPDLPIGRFPVRTSAELARLINKTLAYQNKTYGGTAVFVADRTDNPLSFTDMSDGMLAQLPLGWQVTRLHLDDLAPATARMQLVNRINAGVALVNYTGHSSMQNWSNSSFLAVSHVNALANTGRPTVVVQYGCYNTYYSTSSTNMLSYSFLSRSDQGAAAILGGTLLVRASSEAALGPILTRFIAQPGMSLGQAVQLAKAELALAQPGLVDVQLGWTLLGDPALMVQP